MNRIRELREQRGWRQEDLAARLHKNRQSVGHYETGIRGLDAETICQLCDIFGCTADYLLCRSSSPAPVIAEEDAAVLDAASVRVGSWRCASVLVGGIVRVCLSAVVSVRTVTALAPYRQEAIGSSTA